MIKRNQEESRLNVTEKESLNCQEEIFKTFQGYQEEEVAKRNVRERKEGRKEEETNTSVKVRGG